MPGLRCHGAEFTAEAVNRGAAAILTDRAGAEIAADRLEAKDVQIVLQERPRRALSAAAAHWFGSAPETLVAVTGTNGKTSVASMCRQIWQLLDRPAASLGTLGVEGAYSAQLSHTTPDPITMHRMLAEMSAVGVTHAAIEASSHGLAQQRLHGVELRAAAFTNLTHDHLDYHKDSEAYFASKAILFSEVLPRGGTAVICIDAPRGPEMAKLARQFGHKVVTVGGKGADIALTGRQITKLGQVVRLNWAGQLCEFELRLLGDFQAWNAFAAAGLAVASGEPREEVLSALKKLQGVRGRLQLAAQRGNGAAVFVDYAHTPDALRSSLRSVRQHFTGRVVVVFGAGGDRDRAKRPEMGKTARKYADAVIVTDDNPRNEDPASIRAEILSQCPDALDIGDRAEAILRGVDMLAPGDVLLIAGKGHESGQVIGDATYPFDDAEQASIAVSALQGG